MKRSRSRSGFRSSSTQQPARRKRTRRLPPTWGGERREDRSHLIGNYSALPGYRPGGGGLGKISDSDAWHDYRLDALPPDFFVGKDVCDVGCGAGYASIIVGERHSPRSVLGIDVAPELIARARSLLVERLAMLASVPSAEEEASAPSVVPLSLRVVQGVTARLPDEAVRHMPDATTQSLRRVSFCRSDFLLGDGASSPDGAFDVVLCFGVTKWLHLNHGDDGVRLLFRKLHRSLREGGALVLLAQPWSSYRKKASMTQHVAETYASIRLRPADFMGTLLGEVGFRSLDGAYCVKKPSGAQRDLYVFRK
jgi:7SK snRNA methylphosphate capping enzyme